MAVSKRTRYEVLRRDNFTCRYCGASAPDATLTVDHVKPVALGGADGPENLVAACRDCNYGKASTSPDAEVVEDVKQDAVRWSAAMKLASERLTAKRAALATYVGRLEDEMRDYESRVTFAPKDWPETAAQFYRAGLPVEDLCHALAIAMSRESVAWPSKWRYMCGIGWTMLRELQDEARSIVDTGGE